MNTNTKILNKLKLSSATYEKAYLPPSGIYPRNASLVQPNNHLIKTIQWGGEGKQSFNKRCWDSWMYTCIKMNLDPYLTPYKNYLKMVYYDN